MSIEQQIQSIRNQIAESEHRYHRQGQVKLLAVSKTKPLSAIEQAYHAGQRSFGENYVQEAVDKIQAAAQSSWCQQPLEWHFIGPLQSNKTRLVAEHFDWVQTVDRAKIAQRLNDQRPSHRPALNICIQVNISHEESKSGIDLNQLSTLAELISKLPNLKFRGLMTIGSKGKASEEFPLMQHAFHHLKNDYPELDTLSMGMTDDMPQAIAYGSTLVRIGTAIFGERDYSQQHH
ncbi:YggS family pyridoxal phosphate-dependent enzyme [Celerinatantimonas diazotrophica]|uniref:Pyridoxal phosphate homeostasis protein n=1 Tax=Celerinatantimonas diazotrophica TaxID=412034 RepID=A0A4R1J9H9_9GAMM|nr:YggS family pyridoxal phosphate-dependent enzyme [Celerinatantimonas diazotrophica]TCK47256.1 hypothetical protein EV690_2964 [Celerinatantimonas diazotrophica]CAG9296028.1 Pyridoxal phosphate homeostasis protein [Celerinatantimonas diazotrophica]